MVAYEGFASVYDMFMEEIDYPAWIQYVQDTWKRLGIVPETVIDLGCGTGNISIPLAKAGYSVMGVDISEEMLAEAQRKALVQGLSIPFFCQDMVEMELPYHVDCVLSLCDSLNYLTEDGELSAAFSAVREHLNPKGLFLFDMNTKYKFQVFGDKTYAAMTEDAAYFWENSFDKEDQINEYYVSFFIRQKNKETYERLEEYHYERAYSLEEVKSCLEENGFNLLNVYDGYRFERAKEDSQRYFFVAQLKEEI